MKSPYLIKLFQTFKRILISILVIAWVAIDPVFGNEKQEVNVPDIFERSLESKVLTPEPGFLNKKTPSRWRGMYFGVGFRHVNMDVYDLEILNTDAESNGVAYNLGILSQERAFEYSRHVSIIDGTGQTFGEDPFDRIEVIQNNFWFLLSPRLSRNAYLNYGFGIQFAQVRSMLIDGADTLEKESSIVAGLGGTYFLTNHLLFHYRYSHSINSNAILESNNKSVMPRTQLHTLFWEYYFPL